jgi:hypothetical protein
VPNFFSSPSSLLSALVRRVYTEYSGMAGLAGHMLSPARLSSPYGRRLQHHHRHQHQHAKSKICTVTRAGSKGSTNKSKSKSKAGTAKPGKLSSQAMKNATLEGRLKSRGATAEGFAQLPKPLIDRG